MDLNLPLRNLTSEALTVVQEALRERKTFLNVDGTQLKLMFVLILLLKCSIAGYAMKEVVPRIATVLLACTSIPCFIKDCWLPLARQVAHSMAHIGIQCRDENIVPHIVIWVIYSFFDEFFLDCYVVLAFLIFIWKQYATRPWDFCALIGCLCGMQFLMDQLVSVTSSVLQNLIWFYVPVILIESFGTTNRLNILPHTCMFVWAVSKLPSLNWSLHAQRFTDSYLNDLNSGDLLDEFGRWRAALTVDENERYAEHCFLLLFKSCIAAFAAINVLGRLKATIVMNAIWACFSLGRNTIMAITGVGFLIMNITYQIFFDWKQCPLIGSCILWFLFCFVNDHFHLLLDMFLLISALMYVITEYPWDPLKALPIIFILYFVHGLSDVVTGEKFNWTKAIATLYIPGMVISTLRALNTKSRYVSTAAFILLWFVLMHREQTDYCVNEYIPNSFEMMETSIRSFNSKLNNRRMMKGAEM